MTYIVLSFLFAVVYQDFTTRTIYAWLIPVLSVSLGILAYQSVGWLFFDYLWKNAIFIVLQLFCLVLYFSIKHQQWTNITEHYLGWGDILFFVPMLFFASTLNFILFFIVSLFLVLSLYLVGNLIMSNKMKTIPLAGGQALCMMIALCTPLDLYDDRPLLNYLIQYNT